MHCAPKEEWSMYIVRVKFKGGKVTEVEAADYEQADLFSQLMASNKCTEHIEIYQKKHVKTVKFDIK